MFRSNRLLFMIAVMAAIALLSCHPTEANVKSIHAIILPEEPTPSERYAAEALSAYLKQINHEDSPIIHEGEPFDGYGFYIGNTSFCNASDILGKTDGSYNLVPVKNGLAIYGAGTRGTIYGVYGYLEDYCGYRCFTAEMGMNSYTGEITYPEEIVEFNCCFEYTDTDWRSPYDTQYSLANGLNGDPHRTLEDYEGGDVEYLGGFCHTLSTLFCEASKYFDSHPEYFALHDGERVPYQLCLTNEGVYRTVLSEVMDLLRERHNPHDALQIVSLTQNDNMYYCECDNCKALDEANESHAGTVVTFANKIARAVKAAGYNNVAIDCFAYQYSRKPPTEVVPDDNVIVRFCTIESCFSHPLNDADCTMNIELVNDIQAWNQICDRLYVWDYTANYGYTIGIFPDFGVLQTNMQFFYENGFKGVYEEGNYYISECDSEFGELRSYLISRLLRDPYCDFDKEMELFCNAYYGAGGSFIKDFITEITECSLQKHVLGYSTITDSFSISEEQAAEFDELWGNAIKASSADPNALKNIDRSMLSWRYVKACLGLREFKGSLEESMDKRKELHDDLISHGIKRVAEWGELNENFDSYRFIPVEEWLYADIILILHYDANGGQNGPLTQWGTDYFEISSIVPERDGCTFLGWSKNPNAKVAEFQPGYYYLFTEDTTIYAVWEGDDLSENGESDAPLPPDNPGPSDGNGDGNPENDESDTPVSPDEPDPNEDDETEQAVITYSISVAGTDINSTIARDLSVIDGVALENGGYARYDSEKRILYLKDAEIATPDNPINDSYGLWAVFDNELPLTISVKGHCSITGGSAGQVFPMSLAVWGDLTIQLENDAILDIEAPYEPNVYDNTAMYLGGELIIDGPGTVNLVGVNADSLHGISYACLLSGSATFEGGCTVNACGGTQAAAGRGLSIEGNRITFKDSSVVNLQGGDAEYSYGIQFLRDGDHEFITDNWTGSLIIEGRTSAIAGDAETVTRDLSNTLLYGSRIVSSDNMRLLSKGTYACSNLGRYRKLLLTGSDNSVD